MMKCVQILSSLMVLLFSDHISLFNGATMSPSDAGIAQLQYYTHQSVESGCNSGCSDTKHRSSQIIANRQTHHKKPTIKTKEQSSEERVYS